MSRTDDRHNSPRAVIHRRILDVAGARPEASHETIAGEVPGATIDLVERVLDEYGDPAAETDATDATDAGHEDASAEEASPDESPSEDAKLDESSTEDAGLDETSTDDSPRNDSTDSPATDTDGQVSPSPQASMQTNGHETKRQTAEQQAATDGTVDPESLTDKQRETLRLVYEHPDWSQANVAEALEVSRATVSRRLNDIPGFEWQRRGAFARAVFDGSDDVDGTEDGGGGTETGTDAIDEGTTTSDDTLDGIDDRLDRLETRVNDIESDPGGPVALPPALAHKVVHACFESDHVSEDEEIQLLEALMQS